MYSGKPVIKLWEATTLSWALSCGFRHVTNIPFPTSHFNRFLQFFLPPFPSALHFILLSALVLKLTLKVLFVIADYLGIR